MKTRKTRSDALDPETKKEHLKENKRRYLERNAESVKARQRERVERASGYVNAIKRNPCMDCGGKFAPICMQFDHRPGETKIWGKTGGVARMVAVGSKVEKIQTEIDKCDLVCSNCHWIRTAKANGWNDGCLDL